MDNVTCRLVWHRLHARLSPARAVRWVLNDKSPLRENSCCFPFVVPSSLSSCVPDAGAAAEAVDPKENDGGGAKLIDAVEPVDDFSALPGMPNDGELNVD